MTFFVWYPSVTWNKQCRSFFGCQWPFFVVILSCMTSSLCLFNLQSRLLFYRRFIADTRTKWQYLKGAKKSSWFIFALQHISLIAVYKSVKANNRFNLCINLFYMFCAIVCLWHKHQRAAHARLTLRGDASSLLRNNGLTLYLTWLPYAPLVPT